MCWIVAVDNKHMHTSEAQPGYPWEIVKVGRSVIPVLINILPYLEIWLFSQNRKSYVFIFPITIQHTHNTHTHAYLWLLMLSIDYVVFSVIKPQNSNQYWLVTSTVYHFYQLSLLLKMSVLPLLSVLFLLVPKTLLLGLIKLMRDHDTECRYNLHFWLCLQ